VLARSSRLKHPSGSIVRTPLLVPSFSSKGFGHGPGGGSGVGHIWTIAQEFLTDCMLLSAYDLLRQNIEMPQSAVTELVIVDSGGYETSPTHDLSTVYLDPVEDVDWPEESVISVYDAWPAHVPAILVSHDHHKVRRSLVAQVEAATQLFARYPSQLHCFLIKPETHDQRYVQVDKVRAAAHSLGNFAIIGATEKELGSSVLKRMESIAAIRLALDDAEIAVPIHVFGSLDPLTTILYFISGAEIFDGLTWLRFGFHGNVAVYSQNFGTLLVGIDRRDDHVKATMMRHNLSYLIDLRNRMLKFLNGGDFGHFGDAGDQVEAAYQLLQTRNKRLVS
jgi:hypothetical protein